MVGSEEEDEAEAWVEVEVRLFSITAPSQVIWKGIVRTLALLATTVIHLTISLNLAVRNLESLLLLEEALSQEKIG
jgi:hypothetical protein